MPRIIGNKICKINLLKICYSMKIRKNLSVNDDKNIYLSPQVEIVVVKIECGFAASNGENERWNENSGGGDF